MDWAKKFIEKAKIKHGDKYSYHHVNYIDAHTKVSITCPIHGDFLQSPNHHLRGVGCPKCNGGVHMEFEEFNERAKKIHGDKYDYSKIDLINRKNGKVCIICPEHGEFWQTPTKHLDGHGCPNCCHSKKYTTETFIEACNKKFGENFIDYSKVNYINRNTDILLKCKKCGKEFLMNPHNHLKRGDGCPVCRLSKLEKEVYNKLLKEGIKFDLHKWFSWLNNGKSHKSLDFYLPDYSAAIECQGIQHFKPIDFFGGKKMYEIQSKNDIEKYELCKENGIDVKYFSNFDEKCNYKVFSNLDELISVIRNK